MQGTLHGNCIHTFQVHLPFTMSILCWFVSQFKQSKTSVNYNTVGSTYNKLGYKQFSLLKN